MGRNRAKEQSQPFIPFLHECSKTYDWLRLARAPIYPRNAHYVEQLDNLNSKRRVYEQKSPVLNWDTSICLVDNHEIAIWTCFLVHIWLDQFVA